MHSIESRFVAVPSNILFAGVHVALFSPEIVKAGAVKGLKAIKKKISNKADC